MNIRISGGRGERNEAKFFSWRKIMKKGQVSQLWMIMALVAIGTGFGFDKAMAASPDPADFEDGVQVLTRGPVHEAFAEMVMFNPEPGIVVTKMPPNPIEEVPPDAKPEGDNVTWIPGYWAWDNERSNFIWISGIWRALPPGRQWLPGYWSKSEQGFQWLSGYWADADITEIEYLPDPPKTVEIGPDIAAPSADYVWVPGCWVWIQNRYAWRPGYWAVMQSNWDWIPAHYVWTPRGYVFVDGYWDHSIDRRGVLFAPVYFEAGVYKRHGFSYSPTIVIDSSIFSDQLFLRPHYQHYYFGDYYDVSYQKGGFRPSFSFHSSREGYDPIYVHQRWKHQHDRDWDHDVQVEFQYRRDHEDARPPRTWVDHVRINASKAKSKGKHFGIGVGRFFKELVTGKESSHRFRPVAEEDRQHFRHREQEVQEFRVKRQELEVRTEPPSEKKTLRQTKPVKVRLPRSPIMGKPTNQFGKGQAPPSRHEAPKPDLRVVPTIKTGGRSESPRENPRDDSQDKHKGESKKKSNN
jgi:hypothetical protein